MREQIEQRLAELKAEFETGQKMLAEIEQKRMGLEQMLLRISGAIQVLDEMLAENQPSSNGATSVSAEPSTIGSRRGTGEGNA